MITDESHRLHIGIDDGRTDKFHAARFKIFGQGIANRRGGRDLLGRGPVVVNGRM